MQEVLDRTHSLFVDQLNPTGEQYSVQKVLMVRRGEGGGRDEAHVGTGAGAGGGHDDVRDQDVRNGGAKQGVLKRTTRAAHPGPPPPPPPPCCP